MEENTTIEKKNGKKIVPPRTHSTKEMYEFYKKRFPKKRSEPYWMFKEVIARFNKKAADAVISLAEMMRYAITSDERGGTIALEDEMEQTQNLINLFKLRKTQPLYLKVNFAQHTKHLRFIPLVLLTLAENMFKEMIMHYVDSV